MSEVLPLRMILPPSSPDNRQFNSNHSHQNSHHNNESQQFSSQALNPFISNHKSMTSNDSKNWVSTHFHVF